MRFHCRSAGYAARGRYYVSEDQFWLVAFGTVISLDTRTAIGWSLHSCMHTPLIVKALVVARGYGRLHP